jgi:nucleoside-diphosphate-sugar epimerase
MSARFSSLDWFSELEGALTSSISAVGSTCDGRPADERTRYPKEWMGLTYPDSKYEGERVALQAAARHGVEVVVVNPGYVLGAPVDRSWPYHPPANASP